MRYGIVEGEPGIFPDNIARMLRGLGRVVTHRRRPDPPPPQSRPPADEPTSDPEG